MAAYPRPVGVAIARKLRQSTQRYRDSFPYWGRGAIQFIIDWIEERERNIAKVEPDRASQVTRYHEKALEIWRQRLDNANAP